MFMARPPIPNFGLPYAARGCLRDTKLRGTPGSYPGELGQHTHQHIKPAEPEETKERNKMIRNSPP